MDGAFELWLDVGGDLKPLIEVLSDGDAYEVEDWARHELDGFPVPLRRASSDPRRERLEMLLGEMEARRGEYDRLVRVLHRAVFLGGENPRRLLELLLEREPDEAAAVARLLLSAPDCPDRATVEKILERCAKTPEGWPRAVADLVANPTDEGWEALFTFTPPEAFYNRVRMTCRQLLDAGAAPEFVFRCSTRWGVTPDAIELCQNGRVSPQNILQRAAKAPAEAQPLWLGLAASAAQARGDRRLTVDLLKQAYAAVGDGGFPPLEVLHIRECADPELLRMLDEAGIPQDLV